MGDQGLHESRDGGDAKEKGAGDEHDGGEGKPRDAVPAADGDIARCEPPPTKPLSR